MGTADPSSPESQSLASGAAVAQPSQKPREETEWREGPDCSLHSGILQLCAEDRQSTFPAPPTSSWWVLKGSGILLALEGKVFHHGGVASSGNFLYTALSQPLHLWGVLFRKSCYFPALHLFLSAKLVTTSVPSSLIAFSRLLKSFPSSIFLVF